MAFAKYQGAGQSMEGMAAQGAAFGDVPTSAYTAHNDHSGGVYLRKHYADNSPGAIAHRAKLEAIRLGVAQVNVQLTDDDYKRQALLPNAQIQHRWEEWVLAKANQFKGADKDKWMSYITVESDHVDVLDELIENMRKVMHIDAKGGPKTKDEAMFMFGVENSYIPLPDKPMQVAPDVVDKVRTEPERREFNRGAMVRTLYGGVTQADREALHSRGTNAPTLNASSYRMNPDGSVSWTQTLAVNRESQVNWQESMRHKTGKNESVVHSAQTNPAAAYQGWITAATGAQQAAGQPFAEQRATPGYDVHPLGKAGTAIGQLHDPVTAQVTAVVGAAVAGGAAPPAPGAALDAALAAGVGTTAGSAQAGTTIAAP